MASLPLPPSLHLAAHPEWTRARPDAPAPGRRGRSKKALEGRFLAGNDDPIAVLMIGMRVNRWRALRRWVPVMTAMPRMLRELSADPDSGLLGYRLLWGPMPGQTTVIQYWRSAGHIRAFAHDEARTHRPAQDAFWGRYFTSRGAVGIWHEMLSVRAGAYQCLYGDMPAMGIGAITGLKPAVTRPGGVGYEEGLDPAFAAGKSGAVS